MSDNSYEPESTFISDFLKHEQAAGIMLIGASIIAILLANSAFDQYYQLLIDTRVMVAVGAFEIAKPLLLWVNDGLMAVFFLLVGLELKREVVDGELSEVRKVILPALGGIGGMAVPAAIYVYLNFDDPVAIQGWAIPAATDIAFALGILTLLGSRVPASLKIFLTSLAIFDDIGAIVIIALFYTSHISLAALIVAAICLSLLFYLNRRGVLETSPYIVIGAVMWAALLKSGVHATLAGILLAMFIPIRSARAPGVSPLKDLEHNLHAVVAFFILPVFAFCNAGINFTGIGIEAITHPVPFGIALGLFFGKQLGVFGLCWLGVKAGLAKLPEDISWLSLYGVAVLCGVGFTMSLFISSLAFQETGVNTMVDERLGIIIGSVLSGVVGFLIIKFSLRKQKEPAHDS
ncbi:MAG: Na+/H+ antiporter NhaA [Pseudomonadales bacterium]